MFEIHDAYIAEICKTCPYYDGETCECEAIDVLFDECPLTERLIIPEFEKEETEDADEEE